MSKSAKLPITNVLVGDYTAQIEIGAEKNIANVILDTGSSTLAVWKNKFGKAATTATDYVQFVGYGTGHWAGPVLKAEVGFGSGSNYLGLRQTTIAQIQSGMYRGQEQFYPADGIIGLAFKNLNSAAKAGPNFPLSSYDTQQEWVNVQRSYPVDDIEPYFTDIEEAHQVKNKYAFLTRRSFTHHSVDPQNDPLNKGWFVLGGGEEYTDLYTGEFESVAVAADKWWNTELTQIQVGEDDPIPIPSLKELGSDYGHDFSYLGSNSIIDSGTNSISLYADAFDSMMQSFRKLGFNFRTAPTDVGSWPSIFFTLAGAPTDTQPSPPPVTLEVKPNDYWQTNATQSGSTIFNIQRSYTQQLPTNPQQLTSILGLPLMNNYYVVFERGIGPQGLGEIKFAAQNPAGYPS